MPNRPRPRPAPKAFDVFKPGKTHPTPTSRPVIVSHQPKVQDHTVVESHGSLVPNAHNDAVAPRKGQLALNPLGSSSARIRQSRLHPDSTHLVDAAHVRPATSQSGLDTPRKISHMGHVISRPSDAVTKHATLLHHKVSLPPQRTQTPEPSEEPNLAAVPITPVEQSASLMSVKTEGKEELLAAMPIEIRRSIASAEGKAEADWSMPVDVPEPPVAVATSADREQVPINVPIPSTSFDQPSGSVASSETTAAQVPPTVSTPAPTQVTAKNTTLILKPERRHSDAIVFIIMLILFLLLATLVVMLLLSGTIAL